MKRILVFAPHNDDEIIGCGGTLIKHKRENYQIYITYITKDDLNNKKREKESKKVCKLISANPIFLNLQERLVEYNKETLKKFVKTIRKVKPYVIYSPHLKDGDHDHVKTGEIVQEASWIANSNFKKNWGRKKSKVKKLRYYEVWSPLINYNLVVNITRFINKKIRALRCYKSQLSYMRYDRAIKGLNVYRAVMNSKGKYAEVFYEDFITSN